MKNSIYIPLLFLTALAYISAFEKYNKSPLGIVETGRGPASAVETQAKKECKNTPSAKERLLLKQECKL